jgi:hypothetical protein
VFVCAVCDVLCLFSACLFDSVDGFDSRGVLFCCSIPLDLASRWFSETCWCMPLFYVFLDVTRKGMVCRHSVLAVVVINAPGLVDVYSGDNCFLLVTSKRLLYI